MNWDAPSTLVWFLALIIIAFLVIILKKPQSSFDHRKTRKPDNQWRGFIQRMNALDHRKVRMPDARRNRRRRGHAEPSLLLVISVFTAVLLFIPVVAFILTAVMGMGEPRW